MAATDARTLAIEALCSIGLHQSFLLPDSLCPHLERPLRITYSEIGYLTAGVAEPEPCVVLFIPGLMGGRYTLCRSGSIARRLRIRIITIDKPGTGGSTPVPIGERLAVYLVAVPILLRHLGIKYVTLASHSGGAPYLLQTLLAERGLLHPKRPHIVLLAPWVLPRDGPLLMRLATALPYQTVGQFHSYAATANRMFSFSSGLSNGLAGRSVSITEAQARGDEQQGKRQALGKAVLSEMEGLMTKYMFAENIKGCSDDALLLLGKHMSSTATISSHRDTGVVDWLDYQAISVVVTEREKQLSYSPVDGKALRIDVLHSEKDAMIGANGSKQFDACWEDKANPGTIDYESRTIKGVTHDSILDPTLGISEMWLTEVASRWYG